MNILVIGGKGFLGRNIVSGFSQQHVVYVADCVESEGSNYFNVNLEDIDAIIGIIERLNIQMVAHLASTIIPISDGEQYIRDMTGIYLPTLRLLDYCAEKEIKFLFFSSGGAIYGNHLEVFNEHTKREPMSFYGLSKLNLENLIQFYSRTKELQYLIIRPSNPYGHGQNIYGRQGIIAVIIGKILKNEAIEIWGDGSAVKDYIYIDDFVYYVSKLIESSDCWNSVVNIGTGVGYSVNDVIKTFEAEGIRLPKVKYIKETESDVKRMILDCTKLHTRFPHKCKSLKEGIKLFWDYASKQ